MKKVFMWMAAALTLALYSCQKTDDIRAEIDSLRGRIAALEASVKDVNANTVALRKLLSESTVIVGCTQTTDPKGYVLELSDGTKLPVIFGQQMTSIMPIMGIDDQGYWIFSLDSGVTFQRLMVGGKPVPAWPTINGVPTPDAEGITPKLKVDADGYWLLSIDGGMTYDQLLLDGEKVNALGDNVEVIYSGFFKSVTVDEQEQLIQIELLSGDKLTLPIENTFGFEVVNGSDNTFFLSDTRVFEVVQKNTVEAILKTTPGWKAVLEEATLTVTSPAAATAAETSAEITVIVTSEKGYIKSQTLRMKLLNKPRAEGCQTWKDYLAQSPDNVLLDFSYAGYMHGEVAPPDAWGLGYTLYDVTKYGADPTGKTSSRKAVEALLHTLRLTGQNDSGSNQNNPNARAIIYFPEGRYILHNDDDNYFDASKQQEVLDSKGNNCSASLSIRGGNYVIKGAGRDKTTLVMDTPCLPIAKDGVLSTPPMMINLQHYSTHSTLTAVTADAPKGAFSVEVGSAAGISAGTWVCLYLKNNDPTLIAQELAPHTVSPDMTTLINEGVLIEDYHQVKSVSGTTITFHEPLMHAVEAKWNWEVRQYPHYENVGVEDLAFEGRAKERFMHHATWADDEAFKPIGMNRLTNSWMRRVDFRSVSEALTVGASANCSVYDVAISGNRGHSAVRAAGSSRIFIGKVNDHASGYSFGMNTNTYGPYMDDAGQFHTSGVSKTSMGVVLWNNTWGGDSFCEAHASQPRATLIDRSQGSFVQGRFGGATSELPCHLDDLIIWNLHATSVSHSYGASPFQWWDDGSLWWKSMPPTIVGFHGSAMNFDTDPTQLKHIESNGTKVEPESLYEAQLRERLGYVPAWLNSLK